MYSWEQRKLGDVADVRDGTHDSPKFYNDGFPLVTSKNLKDGSIDFSDCSFISEQDFDEINKRSKVDPGDILFGMIGTIGKPAIVEYTGFAIKNVALIKEGNIINNRFIYHLLSSKVFDNYIARENAGGTQKFIALNQIRNFIFSAPTLAEQNKIIELLDYISQFITLHQRKLDNLKLKKKALLQKLFPKNGERYPELRFPGFTDAWEQCKLGEIFEYLQNNTLSRDSLNYKNPNIKNIHYGDILVKFDEILDGSNKDIPYINSEVDLSKFSKSLLRDGDIIFSDTAEDDTVGKAIELQNVNAPFILSGLHTIPCRPIIPFGKGYLGNFLNSASYRLQLRPLVQGIKVSSISKSALKDTMIEYPINLDEQEKIGSLFYYIAKMITLHQRKLEKLKLTKKALLQKLFPKNGSNIPELRFKGVTDAWEQRKLGEVVKSYSGGTPTASNKEYYGGDIPFIRSAEINSDTTELYITQRGLDNSSAKIVEKGTILYAMYGATSGEVGISKINGAINQAILAMIPLEYNGKIIAQYLRKNKESIIGKYLQGGQGNLSANIILELPIQLPELEESNRIGNFLESFDTVITLHQRKLEMLKNVKKGLLQKMFV